VMLGLGESRDRRNACSLEPALLHRTVGDVQPPGDQLGGLPQDEEMQHSGFRSRRLYEHVVPRRALFQLVPWLAESTEDSPTSPQKGAVRKVPFYVHLIHTETSEKRQTTESRDWYCRMPNSRPDSNSRSTAAFIERHRLIVRPMAGKLAWKHSLLHEREDLVASGMLGLVKAAESYDPRRGTPERFWAWSHVRMEMLVRHRDSRQWEALKSPLDENIPAPVGAAAPEPHPRWARLPSMERRMLELLHQGCSEREIVRGRLLGSEAHPNNRGSAPIGERRVKQIHKSAIQHALECLPPAA